MTVFRSLATTAAIAAVTFSIAACSDGNGPTAASATHDGHAALANQGRNGAEIGTTGGWSDGKTVTFFYNKPFFCAEPPESGADSNCELGAEPTVAPRGGRIPVLYVMTPLGFRPDESTLQCPVVGSCINHPSTLDVSRVFGPGTENFALPAHSHVIGEEDMPNANAGWWEIEVVGVTDPAVWNQVAQGKSLETVRALQAAGQGITGDIPTNLYLFFGVRP